MNKSENQFAPDPTGANSADGALVSILLYNYAAHTLERCFQSILDQTVITNFEVIFCDDASTDGAWEIALHYAQSHDEKITLSRNNICLGKEFNREKCLQLSKGQYHVLLTATAEFDPHYVRQTIVRLQADKLLEHAYISRAKPSNYFLPPLSSRKRKSALEMEHPPLVSVCIYNYNYGRYLRQCLESVFRQTYANFEIAFSDNASTDDSWQIALEYASRYPGKISLTRNRMNFGPNTNLFNCTLNSPGKYILKLCSDDAIQPEFIARCVSELERHPDAAFAMVHREIMDEEGQRTEEPPFYDRSCVIPGAEQAAVYMMSSVNPSVSQILYNVNAVEGKRMAGNLNDRWFGDRIQDFYTCCESSIIYIKDALLLNRVHAKSDGAHMEGNMLQCMGEFVLLHQLADIAGNYPHMAKARERLAPALDKLGHLCIRYCVRALLKNDENSARRYFSLASATAPTIITMDAYQLLNAYWTASVEERLELLRQLTQIGQLEKRTISYPAPPGSIPLQDEPAVKEAHECAQSIH
jgi:glycosyltransferase involved in cell wall biosynthesis